ncbi:hypothetical protein M4I32_00020 [Microbacterium sp. LRZ72]|nr:hypothetical protein [Microbacterium sp. LRZ72]MDX2375188.1 hypothetical protein [Microbacterium sp. LRZ72]
MRHDEESVGGDYLYFFDGYEGPDGQRLAHESEPVELDVARKRA